MIVNNHLTMLEQPAPITWCISRYLNDQNKICSVNVPLSKKFRESV